jgi:hypothetical protein
VETRNNAQASPEVLQDSDEWSASINGQIVSDELSAMFVQTDQSFRHLQYKEGGGVIVSYQEDEYENKVWQKWLAFDHVQCEWLGTTSLQATLLLMNTQSQIEYNPER